MQFQQGGVTSKAMVNPVILIGVGIFVGIYSGIMGLGGGTVMIPVLVLLLGFSQHQASGRPRPSDKSE